MKKQNIWGNFNKLINSDISIKDFEEWIYTDKTIEKIIGKDNYVTLVSMNYTKSDSKEKVQKYLVELFESLEPELYDKYRVYNILKGMLDGQKDLVSGCRRLVQLRKRGLEFIPKIFVGFDSELDDVPLPEQYSQWNKNALGEKLKKIDYYREDIIKYSKKLIKELDIRK
ncbi:hypothetical protein GF362_03220 [Candidatus Dojkabacteria bacterium]|nr:hypothetical protein [Candidatus Dojkabacteria bacterium]